MTDGFLLGRKLLRLRSKRIAIHTKALGDLSAVAWADTPSGRVLWLGVDEAIGIGAAKDEAKAARRRNAILTLHSSGSDRFILRSTTLLCDALPRVLFVDDDGHEGEVDIEGLDLAGHHLWLVGSHSSKRREPKNKDRLGKRLEETVVEPNRFLLARLTVEDGTIVTEPSGDGAPVSAALLPMQRTGGNPLTTALSGDPHLAPFLRPTPTPTKRSDAPPHPGKDNGLDVEGLAVRHGRVYLGPRGPVLHGRAILLAVVPNDDETPGTLHLTPFGDHGRTVAKHFLWLDGMGIRDLSFDGDDPLILAGPTMDMDAAAVWRSHKPHHLVDGSLAGAPNDENDAHDSGRLRRLFDLPTARRCDRAEGLARFDHWGERGLMIVYDKAATARHPLDADGKPKAASVFADIFRLPPD